MKFVTITGSIYELDLVGRKIRRLEGKGAPTSRQGPDGEWKEYQAVSIPSVGSPLLVTWRVVSNEASEDSIGITLQCTQTSPVLSIDANEEDNTFLARMVLSLKQSPEAC